MDQCPPTVAQPSGQDAIAAAWSAERRLLNPAVRSDSETLQKLLAADFHEIGQSGKHWTLDEILNVLISVTAGDPDPILNEPQASMLSSDLVQLTYLLDYEDKRSRRSSLWRITPTGPEMVFHQGTPLLGVAPEGG